MIGNDHVGLVQPFSGAKKTALGNMRASPARALALIRGNESADARRQLLGPGIQISVPAPVTQGLNHFLENRASQLLTRAQKLVGIERDQRISALIRQLMIQLEQTDIAASTLGQHSIKGQAAVPHNIRQVAEQQLLLQRHCR